MRRSSVTAMTIAGAGLIALLVMVPRPADLAPRGSGPPVASTAPRTPAPMIEPVPVARWANVAWQRVPHPNLALQGSDIHGAAADGSSIVLWGETTGGIPAGQPHGAMWVSGQDGDWRLVDLMDPGGTRFAVATLAIGPAGIVVNAVGDGRSRVMWSRDGTEWQTAADVPDGMSLGQVFAGPDGFVILGGRDGRPLLWHSDDGRSWGEVPLPGPGDGSLQLSATGGTRIGWLLYGVIERANGTETVILRSGDRVRWERMAADDPALTEKPWSFVGRIVQVGDGFLATGSAGDARCAEIVLAASGGLSPLTADTCIGPAAATWVSDDALTWRSVEPVQAAAGPRWLEGRPSAMVATPGGDGLLTVEAEGLPQDEARAEGLWTTADGVSWRRLGDIPRDAWVTNGGGLMLIDGRPVIASDADGGDVGVWVGIPAS